MNTEIGPLDNGEQINHSVKLPSCASPETPRTFTQQNTHFVKIFSTYAELL